MHKQLLGFIQRSDPRCAGCGGRGACWCRAAHGRAREPRIGRQSDAQASRGAPLAGGSLGRLLRGLTPNQLVVVPDHAPQHPGRQQRQPAQDRGGLCQGAPASDAQSTRRRSRARRVPRLPPRLPSRARSPSPSHSRAPGGCWARATSWRIPPLAVALPPTLLTYPSTTSPMPLQVLGKGDKLVEPEVARQMAVLLKQMQVGRGLSPAARRGAAAREGGTPAGAREGGLSGRPAEPGVPPRRSRAPCISHWSTRAGGAAARGLPGLCLRAQAQAAAAAAGGAERAVSAGSAPPRGSPECTLSCLACPRVPPLLNPFALLWRAGRSLS